MSIFKEKDEFITNIFKRFQDESDDEDSEVPDESPDRVVEEEANNIKPEVDEAPSTKVEVTDQCDQDHGAGSKESSSPLGRSRPKLRSKKPPKPQVECIDLVDEPESQPENLSNEPQLIELDDDDSDTQVCGLNNEVLNTSVNTSINSKEPTIPFQDVEDYDYNLKLILAGNYRSFRTTYRTKLRLALADLINDLASQGKELLLMFGENKISLDESPASLDLASGTFLKAIMITNPAVAPTQRAENGVTVKLQDGHRKHTKEFVIEKNLPMLELKKKYLNAFNLDMNTKVRLMFDGDIVDDEATAEELDIEDDCVIDVLLT